MTGVAGVTLEAAQQIVAAAHRKAHEIAYR